MNERRDFLKTTKPATAQREAAKRPDGQVKCQACKGTGLVHGDDTLTGRMRKRA